MGDIIFEPDENMLDMICNRNAKESHQIGEVIFMAEQGNCDTCVNFVYDEDYEYYVCDMDLDEDDMVRFLTGNTNSCPYYQLYDEYKIVRHQM